MLRPGVLVVLLFAVLAGDARAACPRTAEGPRFVVGHRDGFGVGGPARTVVCDRRRGRRTVLAEARSLDLPEGAPPPGTYLGFPVLAGSDVAWVEVDVGARGLTATAVLVDLRRGVRRRTVVGRSPSVARFARLRAVPLLGGAFAATVWDDPADPAGVLRAEVRRPGRPVSVVRRGQLESLGVEDGRTLRFGLGPGDFLDVAALPARRGCPVRERFRPARGDFGGLVVTVAFYGGEAQADVVRACRPGTGRDPIVDVAGDFGTAGNGTSSRLLGGRGRAVAVVTSSFNRYYGCESAVLRSVDVRSGATLRQVRFACPAAPRRSSTVVLPSGGIAWRTGAALLALAADGTVVELDRGRIRDVRADGDVLRWTRDGVARSAAV